MSDRPVAAEELRAIPFFARFSDEDLERVLGRARVVRFGSGEPILERGERACTMYVVLSGNARVEVGGRYHDLARGDFLGEMGALSSKPRMATVTAGEDLEALEIDCGNDVDAFLSEHPAVAAGMVKVLVERLREVEERLDSWMGIHRA